MQITEQTYRDFRLFYRSVKNSDAEYRAATKEALAVLFLGLSCSGSSYEQKKLAAPYLVNGPRCDGDVLTIYEAGIVQVGYRYACSNKIVEG